MFVYISTYIYTYILKKRRRKNHQDAEKGRKKRVERPKNGDLNRGSDREDGREQGENI